MEQQAPQQWWRQTEQPGSPPAPPDILYQREALVKAAAPMLYSDKGLDSTVGMLKAGNDPMDAAAKMTATIMSAATDKLRSGGVEINQDALFSAGREILERVVVLGRAVGVIDLGETTTQIQQAMDSTAEKALGYYQQMQQEPQEQGQPQGQPQQPQGQPQAPQAAKPIIGGV